MMDTMAASEIVDLHVHAFPEPAWPPPLSPFRDQVKGALARLGGLLHRAQPSLRHLSEDVRRVVDPVSLISALPSLLVGSSASDLDEALELSQVRCAVVVPILPYSTNEWVATESHSRPAWIPATLVSDTMEEVDDFLESEFKEGRARVLKLHPAMDGAGPASRTYLSALEWARSRGVPVLVHSGAIHAKTVLRSPEMGRLEHFSKWFTDFSQVQFVASHMGFHEPESVIALAEEHKNLSVDTSWQPSEVIGEAVRRIGAERVYFASDWPLLGGNIEVGLSRIRDAENAGWLTSTQADLIRGRNAARLLKLDVADCDAIESQTNKSDAEDAEKDKNGVGP